MPPPPVPPHPIPPMHPCRLLYTGGDDSMICKNGGGGWQVGWEVGVHMAGRGTEWGVGGGLVVGGWKVPVSLLLIMLHIKVCPPPATPYTPRHKRNARCAQVGHCRPCSLQQQQPSLSASKGWVCRGLGWGCMMCANPLGTA